MFFLSSNKLKETWFLSDDERREALVSVGEEKGTVIRVV